MKNLSFTGRGFCALRYRTLPGGVTGRYGGDKGPGFEYIQV